MTRPELLLGDEAVALAAIHSGISGAYSYPGTPATELFEYIEPLAPKHQIQAHWASNEKVAYELAVGMTFTGKKAIVSMKHVGLNVAMDPFVSSALTELNGGLVVCVADDPGMHSSQNEQDTRYLARFALMPCMEPSDQQEAYDMTREAFKISTDMKIPVVVRLTTRLAHSRSAVVTSEQLPQNPLNKATDRSHYVLLPAFARAHYKKVTEKNERLTKMSEESRFNELNIKSKDRTKAVITNGIAFNYVKEAFGGDIPHPYLKISMYPLPYKLIRELVAQSDDIYIIEEGYPIIEEIVRGVSGIHGKRIHGKLDGTVPRTGEITPNIAAQALGRPYDITVKQTLDPVPSRPPQLCKGCPHSDSYFAIKEALSNYKQPSTFSDIGCYTLGFYPPYDAIETCIEMGGSIGMMIGAAHGGLWPVMATIGDSTFGHSGMTCLLTAVSENLDMNLAILDNSTVAMTGTQDSMSTGPRLEQIVAGLGVDPKHIRILNPLPKNREENVKVIREEIEHKGPSVLIFRRPCIQIKR